jgi:hypothetical protein
LSDNENMDTTEDERANARNDEGQGAEVEGHKVVFQKNVTKSDEADGADVEGHRLLAKTNAQTDDAEDSYNK